MNESTSTKPDEPRTDTVRNEIRWDAVAAIIASLVGLLALFVGAYTAYIQREQVRAQVWPYLIGVKSNTNAKLMWMNKGVGPAIVKSTEVIIDGKPRRDWKAVVHAIGVAPLNYDQSFLNGNVLSPGESINWLHFSNTGDYNRFMLAADRAGMAVKVCYCSTLGDCWQTQFGNTDRAPVARCPVLPDSKLFHE